MSTFPINRTLISFGSTPRPDIVAIERAECWTVYNPRTFQTVPIVNCPANLATLRAYLLAHWTLVNDDESLAGWLGASEAESK